MQEAWARTTASRPCICSCDSVAGSSRLPPGWVAALDLRMPWIAAARLSAGILDEMQSHIFCEPVTRHSFMNSSARAAPDRPAIKAHMTRLKDTVRIVAPWDRPLGGAVLPYRAPTALPIPPG